MGEIVAQRVTESSAGLMRAYNVILLYFIANLCIVLLAAVVASTSTGYSRLCEKLKTIACFVRYVYVYVRATMHIL